MHYVPQARAAECKAAIKNIKELDELVNEFVEFIWKEAVGHLREIFEDTFQNITTEQACY